MVGGDRSTDYASMDYERIRVCRNSQAEDRNAGEVKSKQVDEVDEIAEDGKTHSSNRRSRLRAPATYRQF